MVSRSYTVLPYYIAYALNDLLIMRILPPLAFALPFCLLSGVADDIEYFTYFCEVLILTSTSFASICLFVGAVFPSSGTGTSASVVLVVLSLMFGGLLVNRASSILENKWFDVMFDVTPLSYAYEAMMVLVLDGSTIDFNPKGFKTDVKTTGSIWLANFGMSAKHYLHDMEALGCFTVVFFLMTGIALKISFECSTCSACTSTTSFSTSTTTAETSQGGGGGGGGGGDGGGGGSSHTGSGDANEEDDIYLPAPSMEKGPMFPLSNRDSKEEEEEKEEKTFSPSFLTSSNHHTLTFTDVRATISGRSVLNGVSGAVSTASGGVFAILGPSGAGKTTLLDILAGRKNIGKFRGDIEVDGIIFSGLSQRVSVFGYVMQEETLIDVLTVRESLEFSASLRLKSGNATREQIAATVKDVLNDLALMHVANNKIGSSMTFRGISGGERKRVAIGMELCAEPPVLLLDEPTTGLDSAGAARIMSLLKRRVETKRTIIICTIHTPRSDIFHSLGSVLILKRLRGREEKKKLGGGGGGGGQHKSRESNVVFSGPPSDVALFLERQGYSCPHGMNIADYVLDVISEDDFRLSTSLSSSSLTTEQEKVEDSEGGGRERTTTMTTTTTQQLASSDPPRQQLVANGSLNGSSSSTSYRRTSFDMIAMGEDQDKTLLRSGSVEVEDAGRGEGGGGGGNSHLDIGRSWRHALLRSPVGDCCCCCCPRTYTSWDLAHGKEDGFFFRCRKFFRSVLHLLRLELVRFMRRPQMFVVHVLIAVSTGLFFGGIYYDLKPDTDGVWNRLMGLFAQVSLFALLGISSGSTWHVDRLRFIRERSSGYYGTLPYFLSKWIFDSVLYRIIPCLLFVWCSYDFIGYSTLFNSTDVNTPSFFNASGCVGRVVHAGICTSDPLAHPAASASDDGAFGRSRSALIISLSLVAMSSAALSQAISSCTTNLMVSNFISVLVVLLMLMFSGALVSHVNMPTFVSWITDLSPFSFAFEAMSVGNFQEQCFLFNPTTVSSLFAPGGRQAKVCVETSGYVWLLNFGCTTAANYTTTDMNGNILPYGCHYTNETIERDFMAALSLLAMYTVLGVLFLYCIRERR